MNIKFGYKSLEFPGSDMGELRSSNALLKDTEALQSRLQQDGYLFLKDFIERGLVLEARNTILRYMDEQGALAPGKPLLEGAMPQGARTLNMMGRPGTTTGISHHTSVLEVLENRALFILFNRLFGTEADTYSYKWLRAVGNEGYTGAHYDIVYMGRGSQELHSVWIPYGDIQVEQGTLAICEGSHRLPGFDKLKSTYGKLDVDRDVTEGWFSNDPLEISDKFGGQWKTTNFKAGDIILFGMYTMHASTTNTTHNYRLSCDIRFQPKNQPFDDRWGGKIPKGHTDFKTKMLTSMEEARKKWDV